MNKRNNIKKVLVWAEYNIINDSTFENTKDNMRIAITMITCCRVLVLSSLKINSPGPMREESVIFISKSLKLIDAILMSKDGFAGGRL